MLDAESLAIVIFLSFMIVLQSPQCCQSCQKVAAFHNTVKLNSHLPQQKLICNLFLPQEKGYKNNTSGRLLGHLAFRLFLVKRLFQSLRFSSSSSCKIPKKQKPQKLHVYVKLVSTTFSAHTSLKKFIDQFSLLGLKIDHQHSIC